MFCVFDRDRNTTEQLMDAKKKAKTKGIEIIFSNPSFELWLLLHYVNHTKSCENSELLTMLKKFLPDYHKADPELFLKTRQRTETAIHNAYKMTKMHTDRGVELVSSESNPVTLVNELVEVLYGLKKKRR